MQIGIEGVGVRVGNRSGRDRQLNGKIPTAATSPRPPKSDGKQWEPLAGRQPMGQGMWVGIEGEGQA